jgi:hypothetical protein
MSTRLRTLARGTLTNANATSLHQMKAPARSALGNNARPRGACFLILPPVSHAVLCGTFGPCLRKPPWAHH